MHLTALCGALVLCASFAAAQTIPVTHVGALDGPSITLPQESHPKPLLILIGFSRKSSKDFSLWNQHFLPSYLSSQNFSYYELIDMQGVPGFAKTMARHGMRRQIHGVEQAHFAPFDQDEQLWKAAVHYSKSEDTYLVLTDAKGHVLWCVQGAPDEAKMAGLTSALTALNSAQ